MSLFLPQAHESMVRSGGFEFSLDPTAGLWLVPARLSFWGLPMDDMTVKLAVFSSGLAAIPASVPATASPLWEDPTTVVGEILGYRAWNYDVRIMEDGSVCVLLESLHYPCRWEGPVVTADEPPQSGGDHGLYAVGLDAHHQTNFEDYVSDAPVWGRVALSGLVVEGQHGYRAERATIQELWVNPEAGAYDADDSPEGLCKLLGDRYQCDASVRIPSWKHLTAEMTTAKD